MKLTTLLPKSLCRALIAASALAAAVSANAGLQIPYVSDADTMHLWHLDEPAGSVYSVDAIATDGTGSTNAIPITLTNIGEPLAGPFTNTLFGTPAFAPSLGTSYTGLNKTNLLYGGSFPDVSQFRNPTSGAFTFEALIKLNAPFSGADMEILTGDNGGAITARGWQWRISSGAMEWDLLGGSTDNDTKPALPLSGPDAIATNVWYHAAITYTGQSPTNGDTPNIITMYWTLLDGSRTNADVLARYTATRPLDGSPEGAITPNLGIWGSGRNINPNPGNNEGGTGSIDEVRVSDVARLPWEMAFTNNGQAFPPSFPTQPPATVLAAYGETLTINCGVSASSPTLQWYQYTATTTNAVTGQTNSTLSIPNATFAQGGSYVLVVSNALNVATSSVAVVTIGASASELYATGYDTNGDITPDVPDGHYTLIESQDPEPYLGPDAMIFEWSSPIQFAPNSSGSYAPTNGSAMWIGDQGNLGGNLPNSVAGTYIYRNTFLLDQASPTNIFVQVPTMAMNGTISNILINGRSTGLTISAAALYQQGFTFSNFNNVLVVTASGAVIASQSYTNTNSAGWFVPGINTIDFPNVVTSGASAIYIGGITAIGHALPPGIPTILTQPGDETVRDATATGPGSIAQYSVVATGRSPLSYQWYSDSTLLTGATNRKLNFYNPSAGAQGTNFYVVISNASGSVTSRVAALTLLATNQPPVAPTLDLVSYAGASNVVQISDLIEFQSYDPSGGQLTFVGADGSSTNGGSIGQAGEELIYLPVPGYVGSDQFTYTVSDTLGATTIGDIEIQDFLAPQPSSQVVVPGSSVSYNVGITNPPAGYHFQWELNGANIAGATTGLLSLNNLQASNTGNYVFVATDSSGNQWPAPAVSLTVEGFPPYMVAITNIFDSSEQGGYPATNAVDGDLTTYWVSYGTAAGQQPTAASPEWLFVQFGRPVALSEFLIYPRNGYGPDACQMLVNCSLDPGVPTNGFETFGIPTNGTSVFSNTMANSASPLDVVLSKPVTITNAEFLVTSSYSTENVQVAEMIFNERALPGSFGDWELKQFTAAQINNPALTSPYADPDGDGVLNLQEFAVGGNPNVKDATNAAMHAVILPGNEVGVEYQVTNNLGDVTLNFQASADLLTWTNVTPTEINVVTNKGTISIEEAVFPQQPPLKYYREDYGYTNTTRE